MSDELKPCPGCGREQWTDEQRGDIIPYRKNMRRRCDWCDLEMRDWNTRPLEDALRAELAAKDAEIARLKEEVATLEDQCANFYRYTQR